MSKKVFIALLFFTVLSGQLMAGKNVFSVAGKKIYINDREFKIIGLRCSNALISEEDTKELIDNLSVFKSYGVNTVSVFVMGSRFGDIKGYNPDSTLNETYSSRLAQIIEKADELDMVVLVGCLYWSTSKANEDLGHWKQEDANKAVAYTVKWLTEKKYTNVFVDPDNEGMAARAMKWSIESMIDAAKQVNPEMVMGYNHKAIPPKNADILMHFSPKDSMRPWIESEGTMKGYWGKYSKEKDYYNYIRIGRYTMGMKKAHVKQMDIDIKYRNGFMLASTYLQCAPSEGIGGPFMNPGGEALDEGIHDDVKKVQSDAGILWWLKYVKAKYGAWDFSQLKTPMKPAPKTGPTTFNEVDGIVSMEAENAVGQDWIKVENKDASGGIVMVNPGGNNKDMTFKINFTKPGKYYVWFRHCKPQSATDKSNDCVVYFNRKPLMVENGNEVIGMGTHQKSLNFESRPKSHHSKDRGFHPFFEVKSAGVKKLVVNSRGNNSKDYLVDKIILIHEDAGGNERAPKEVKNFGVKETR